MGRYLKPITYKGPAVEPGTRNEVVSHGICHVCGKRRYVYPPKRYCEPCLLADANALKEVVTSNP